MPAMSTTLSVAGITFSVAMKRRIVSSRSSGTATTPTFGSIVQKG
jgi:hypothetical protein